MSNIFQPRDYQQLAIDWIKKRDRCALFLPMGMGKSASVLAALDTFPVLVIAPLRVAKTTWPDEINKWGFPYKYSVVCGSREQREVAATTKADVYMINYENLQWLVEYFGSKWPFRTVVADELTRLKSFRLRQGGKQSKALSKVAFTGVKKFIGLTGTPSPRHLTDLWGQLWFIDKGERLGRSFSAFTDKWFTLGYNGFTLEPKANAENEILSRISDVCMSINPADFFPVDQPVFNTINVQLSDKAMKLYKDMEREMYIQINEVGIEAFNAAAKTIKCLQLCNGAIYTDDGYSDIDSVKLDALEEIVEETDSPILVSYQFKSDLDRLMDRFPQGVHLGHEPNVIEDWNKGKIPLLFAHPASAGHGLSLQHGGNVLVYFSHGWNLEHHQQILERIGPMRQKQSGYNRPVFVHSIVAKDTIEQDVIDRLQGKATQQEILLRFLSRSKKVG